MQDDGRGVEGAEKVEALPRQGTAGLGPIRVAVCAVEVEVLEAGEGEAEQGAAKDEPEDEVVAMGEADGVIQLAGPGYKAVSRWST